LEQLAGEYIWFPCNEEHLHFHLFGPVSEGSSVGKKQGAEEKNRMYEGSFGFNL